MEIKLLILLLKKLTSKPFGPEYKCRIYNIQIAGFRNFRNFFSLKIF